MISFKLFLVRVWVSSWTAWTYPGFTSFEIQWWLFNTIREGLRVTWVCYSEILVRILTGELSFFFFDPTLWNPSLLFFFSALTLWSRLQRATSGGVLAFGLQLVQWWRFLWISENLLEICMDLFPLWFCVLNSEAELRLSVRLCWIGFDSELGFNGGVLRVLGFLSLLWFFDPTESEREWKILFVMWRVICGSFSDLHSTWPYIGCHVCAEPMEMRHLDLDSLRGTCGLNWKKRTKNAILWNWRTELQLKQT